MRPALIARRHLARFAPALVILPLFLPAVSSAQNDDSAALAEREDNMVQRAARRMDQAMRNSESDVIMYQQMYQVSNWLNQYCVWNHHWPEPIDETNQAVAQLCELVPNNPYRWSKEIQVSKGQSTDPDYFYYNQPMDVPPNEASGFEGDSNAQGTSYEAYGAKRVKLVYNPSLNVNTVEEWRNEAPDDWQEPPGTITAISNSSDLVVVWGAGADGRPVKIPGSNRVRLVISNVQMSPTGVQND